MMEPGHKQAIVLAPRWCGVPGFVTSHSLPVVSRYPARSQALILVFHYYKEGGNYLQSNSTEGLHEGDAVFGQIKLALPGPGQMGWLNAYLQVIIHGVIDLSECFYPVER